MDQRVTIEMNFPFPNRLGPM